MSKKQKTLAETTADFMKKNKHLLDELKETAERDRSSTFLYKSVLDYSAKRQARSILVFGELK